MRNELFVASAGMQAGDVTGLEQPFQRKLIQ